MKQKSTNKDHIIFFLNYWIMSTNIFSTPHIFRLLEQKKYKSNFKMVFNINKNRLQVFPVLKTLFSNQTIIRKNEKKTIFMILRHINRYLKNGVSKSIVHVTKHANFQLNFQANFKQVRLFIHHPCLKHVEKKKLLGCHNRVISLNTVAKWLFNYFKKMQKQPPGVFYKKVVVKNLAIFTEKHLCWGLLLIQNIAKFLRAPILKNIYELLLLKMCS